MPQSKVDHTTFLFKFPCLVFCLQVPYPTNVSIVVTSLSGDSDLFVSTQVRSCRLSSNACGSLPSQAALFSYCRM